MSKRNLKRAELLANGLARQALLLGLVLSAAACKQASAPLQPSIFTNPNEITLVCFDADLHDEAKQYAIDHPDWDRTLPLECCNKVVGPDDQLEAKLERCSVRNDKNGLPVPAVPVPHVLVTQVQRGEVAAVDLEKKVVLDSDKQIPGYTFVDVGGLPTAIAVPPGLDDGAGTDANAPLWTYVAGRQSNTVRAVPTCHFRTGRKCGPEVAEIGGEPLFPTQAAFEAATERALAGEPFDMLLSADGKGLWITLPDEGLLAYVPLPTVDDKYTPFPEEIVYYPLPGGFDLQPSVPEPETEPYRFACAVGVANPDNKPELRPTDDPAPWEPEPLQMPLSVPAESTRVARPTLLRMVDLSPRGGEASEASKLLFVADEGQMALHVYAQDEAGVSLVTSLPVGAPLRDFAVTPEVPALAPTYAELSGGTYTGDATTKRYLYAIDGRDGSVMMFALSFTAGVPELMPLLAPEPARDAVHQTLNRADRLSMGGDGLAARALDVVDTRARRMSDGVSFDDAYCHIDDKLGFDKQLAALQSASDDAEDAYGDTSDAPLTEQKLAERAYAMASAELSVLKDAGYKSLRGVFLMVATTRGLLLPFDVHDLDLECRAKVQCAVEPDLAIGVVVRRHTPRLSGTPTPVVTVSPTDEIGPPDECPTGYYVDADKHLCVSSDPWIAHGISFSVGYEAPITGVLPNGVLEPASGGRVLLKGPAGLDLCARGANAADRLLVGIASPPDSAEQSDGKCSVSGFTTAPLLRVVEARRDALLLEPLEDDIDRNTLLGCYREFVQFDLRLDDQYYVSSASLPAYQHNNMSAADGTCVRDESLDARFTSRAELGKPFVNQFVAFTLKSDRAITPRDDAGEPEPPPESDGGTADDDDAGVEDAGSAEDDDEEEEIKKEVNPSITVTTLNLQQVTAPIAAPTTRTDALPHRVRYFPENGYLFVVDQASQGLRRFLLTPTFIADDTSVFR